MVCMYWSGHGSRTMHCYCDSHRDGTNRMMSARKTDNEIVRRHGTTCISTLIHMRALIQQYGRWTLYETIILVCEAMSNTISKSFIDLNSVHFSSFVNKFWTFVANFIIVHCKTMSRTRLMYTNVFVNLQGPVNM